MESQGIVVDMIGAVSIDVVEGVGGLEGVVGRLSAMTGDLARALSSRQHGYSARVSSW